jgi:hypothetical protein
MRVNWDLQRGASRTCCVCCWTEIEIWHTSLTGSLKKNRNDIALLLVSFLGRRQWLLGNREGTKRTTTRGKFYDDGFFLFYFFLQILLLFIFSEILSRFVCGWWRRLWIW